LPKHIYPENDDLKVNISITHIGKEKPIPCLEVGDYKIGSCEYDGKRLLELLGQFFDSADCNHYFSRKWL